MNADPDYLKHAILFIDDEEQSQKYFSQIFGRTFKIYVASDGEQGLQLFEEHRKEIGVVVSDQRMPGISGSELLAAIAEKSPDVVNILSTAYSDLEAAIDAVNKGGIYRYVTKPWDLAELEVTLRRAMDYYQLKEQHRSLARMKISGLGQMFHQSRLLACMAVPALLENEASSVRAFRDLLRLSLGQDEDESQLDPYSLEMPTQSNRQELSDRVKKQLVELVELTGAFSAPSAVDLDGLNVRLGEMNQDADRLAIVHSLFQLFKGNATESNLKDLAALLGAYRHGYEIQRAHKGWVLGKTDPALESSSVFEELYALFVDDTFLVSLVLGELS